VSLRVRWQPIDTRAISCSAGWSGANCPDAVAAFAEGVAVAAFAFAAAALAMGLQECTRKHFKAIATSGPCPTHDVVVVDGTELTKFWVGDGLPHDLHAWLEGGCRLAARRMAPALGAAAGAGAGRQVVVFLMDWTHKVTRCKGNETAARAAPSRAAAPRAAPLARGAMGGAADGSDDVTGREHALPWGSCAAGSASKKVSQVGRCVSARQRRAWTRLMASEGHRLLGLRPSQSLVVAGDESGRAASDAVFLTHYVEPDARQGLAGGWCTEAIGGVRDELASDGEADVLFSVVLRHIEEHRGLYDLQPAPAPLRIAVLSKDTDWVLVSALWLAARMLDTPAAAFKSIRLHWLGWQVSRPPAEMQFVDVRELLRGWCAQAAEEGAWEPLQQVESALNRAAALVWLGSDFTRKVKVGAAFGRGFTTVPLQEQAASCLPLRLRVLHPVHAGPALLDVSLRDDRARRALLDRGGGAAQDLVQIRAGAFAVMYWFSAGLPHGALRAVCPLAAASPEAALREHYLAAGFAAAPAAAVGRAALWSWASAAAVGGAAELRALLPIGPVPARGVGKRAPLPAARPAKRARGA